MKKIKFAFLLGCISVLFWNNVLHAEAILNGFSTYIQRFADMDGNAWYSPLSGHYFQRLSLGTSGGDYAYATSTDWNPGLDIQISEGNSNYHIYDDGQIFPRPIIDLEMDGSTVGSVTATASMWRDADIVVTRVEDFWTGMVEYCATDYLSSRTESTFGFAPDSLYTYGVINYYGYASLVNITQGVADEVYYGVSIQLLPNGVSYSVVNNPSPSVSYTTPPGWPYFQFPEGLYYVHTPLFAYEPGYLHRIAVHTNVGDVLHLSAGLYVTAELSNSAPVPEPTTMLLLASGLVGLVGLRRKFRKN